MSDRDWYQRRTWTSSDRLSFFDRLKRSRGSFYKAQYARLQALELQNVGTEESVRGALELLDLIIAQWRFDAQLASVLHQYAGCCLLLDEQARAIEFFRATFQEQRENPGHKTTAHLDFGWVAAMIPLPELFQEALNVLDEFRYPPISPFQVFRDAVIRAIILHSHGEDSIASDYAWTALRQASIIPDLGRPEMDPHFWRRFGRSSPSVPTHLIHLAQLRQSIGLRFG